MEVQQRGYTCEFHALSLSFPLGKERRVGTERMKEGGEFVPVGSGEEGGV